ncbi:MAG TPA: hypothetical protein VHV10_15620 [Ktedonobacteraceae bacterium]|nr:hypothetical protein [Ktedonobacteraceae bacterium]
MTLLANFVSMLPHRTAPHGSDKGFWKNNREMCGVGNGSDKGFWKNNREMCGVGNGRDKSGPYRNIRPAEAGAGRYRCPAYKLLDEKVKHHNWVPTLGQYP